ncbi:anhydro-N-acetylmuramic acid kinase [Paracidobacterium acidisoli]|uniref:Anhydro-N-acetylmuramic acid kinase n=1 Tax=Paracidobacterium acidisoli TaxID=2303751 RepID=A0A372IQS9_9BACT|nr:anhydro-N-acetylmuramic acid kinase [Paracidobacterium acidisoli]
MLRQNADPSAALPHPSARTAHAPGTPVPHPNARTARAPGTPVRSGRDDNSSKRKSLIVAGVMSGTSADGIDVAVVRISPRRGARAGRPGIELIGHRAFPFSKALRTAVLAAMDAKSTSTAELARLHWRLGMAYAEAVRATVTDLKAAVDLVGCHGQTVYHQGVAQPYAGRSVACTWQLGEPALIAAEMRVPVVSNFRPADMAAGGQGAPLVPLLDYVLFTDTKRARVLQNLGGIGNLTVIPAGAGPERLIAFDTGPANMVIDALMERLFDRAFDKDGRVAARGRVLDSVVKAALRERYFAMKPPKSAGREQFGAAYTERFLHACERAGGEPADAVATAAALTAESIRMAVERWVKPLTGRAAVDYIVAGGGARNGTLMRMLRERLEPLGCSVRTSGDSGIPVDAKEAVAFALLAWETWFHRPGNLPSATGAKRAVVLGEICYG